MKSIVLHIKYICLTFTRQTALVLHWGHNPGVLTLRQLCWEICDFPGSDISLNNSLPLLLWSLIAKTFISKLLNCLNAETWLCTGLQLFSPEKNQNWLHVRAPSEHVSWLMQLRGFSVGFGQLQAAVSSLKRARM